MFFRIFWHTLFCTHMAHIFENVCHMGAKLCMPECAEKHFMKILLYRIYKQCTRNSRTWTLIMFLVIRIIVHFLKCLKSEIVLMWIFLIQASLYRCDKKRFSARKQVTRPFRNRGVNLHATSPHRQMLEYAVFQTWPKSGTCEHGPILCHMCANTSWIFHAHIRLRLSYIFCFFQPIGIKTQKCTPQ